MKKNIVLLLMSIALLCNAVQATFDPRLTRDILIDIDTTLTICCAEIEANFQGTFTVLAAIEQSLSNNICFPVIIHQADVGTTGFIITQSGLYRLGENIVFNPSGLAAAILINANDVVLDLACFSISQGNATLNVDGIEIASNQTRIEIKNGAISSMTDNGIFVGLGTTECTIHDITIENCNTSGIFLQGLPGSLVGLQSLFNIELIGNTIGIQGTNLERGLIKNCSILNSLQIGIELLTTISTTIDSCSIQNTQAASGSAYGIFLDGGKDNTVQNCVIRGVRTNDASVTQEAVGIFIGSGEVDDIIFNNIIKSCISTTNAQPSGLEMGYTFTTIFPVTSLATGQVNNCRWSPNGRYLAVSTTGGIIDIVEYKNSALFYTQQLTGMRSIMAWSPDGSYITLTSAAGVQTIYKNNQGILSPVVNFPGTNTVQLEVAWSPDGRYIATVDSTANPNFLDIWKFSGTTLQLVASLNLTGPYTSLDWSPDSRYLAVISSGGGGVGIYNFTGNSLIFAASIGFITNVQQHIRWSPNGQFLALANSAGSSVGVYRFTGSSTILIAQQNTAGTVVWVAWSPDGKWLAYTDSTSILGIYAFNGTTLSNFRSISLGSGGQTQGLSWAPTGDLIAAGSNASLLQLYSTLQFGQTNFIANNQISVITGPALAAGQPGVSSGRGLLASSHANLVINNMVFAADLGIIFANNIFKQFIANQNPVPSKISNQIFPPL